MVNICTTINNIEASSYGELEIGKARLVVEAQFQKGDAPSSTNVDSSSIGNLVQQEMFMNWVKLQAKQVIVLR